MNVLMLPFTEAEEEAPDEPTTKEDGDEKEGSGSKQSSRRGSKVVAVDENHPEVKLFRFCIITKVLDTFANKFLVVFEQKGKKRREEWEYVRMLDCSGRPPIFH